MNSLSNFFHLKENNTSFRTELLAGLTTFVSMSYILFVNPNILGASGMDKGALFTVTALASAFTCIVMGLVANYPIASAPTLGLNAFFTYTVCLGMKVKWQTALAAVLVASILFILLTIFKVREMIIDAIPADIKYAITAGIGLFIAFIGLQGGHLIQNSDSTLVTIGALNNPTVWITIFGLVVTIFLMIARVPGAIFIGMILAAIFGLIIGQIPMPKGIISAVPSIAPTFGQAIFHISDINTVQMWVVVFTFLLVTFFDTTGTLIGLVQQAGLMKNNKMPRAGQALAADSSGMLVGAVLGTSPVGAFVESSAGIAVGGKTGLAAVWAGIFFLISTIFSPILSIFTTQVTAPALIIVGVLMAENLAHVHWTDLEIAIPCFLIALGMPLTYSISDGLGWGLVVYPISMIAAKKTKQITPMMWILFIVFVIYFVVSRRPKRS